MKTLSRHSLIITFSIIINSLYSQDIFYTVSGEIDNQKVGLNSILFENIQNKTSLLFDNLSEQEEYVINLSTQTLWGYTGLPDLQFDNGFNILKNTAGELSVAINFTPTEPISIFIYNVQGQKLYFNSLQNIIAGNSIDVQLANMGVYFVKVESTIGSKTFKALGSNNINEFAVALNYQKPIKNTNLKRSLNTYGSDFSFQIGDVLRVSVYKSGYWVESKTQTITTSISLIYEINPNLSSFIDARDGQTYKAIEIGSQIWMAENLKYLPAVGAPSPSDWDIQYYYVYDYNGTVVADAKATANYTTYGVLYNWAAAMNSAASSASNPSAVQGVCPSGWHLPSHSEWIDLSNYLIKNGYGNEGGGDDIGKSMASTSSWTASSELGDIGNDQSTNNSSGFSALPGGYFGLFNVGYDFRYSGRYCVWWSATKQNIPSSYVWTPFLINSRDDLSFFEEDISMTPFGFSVRCVKD